MTSAVPTSIHEDRGTQRPVTMFGPDFPFAYDDYLAHPAGLGTVPTDRQGTEVAVIGGGLSGIVAPYELMKLGPRPVAEHDRQHRTSLAATLLANLATGGDISAAARRLSIHPNTCRHRLARTEQLFNFDLADPDERLVLWLQLRLGNAIPTGIR